MIAYGAIFSASIGVGGSYLLFIAQNIQSLVSIDTTTTFLIWCIILPIAIVLSSIRDMKQFTVASFVGDLSVVLGMFVVLGYGWKEKWNTHDHDGNDTTNRNIAMTTQLDNQYEGHLRAMGQSWEQMALALGTIGYLFLIHFLILPIESSMVQPQYFDQVVNWTFVVCAMLSGSFGVLGYIMFGDETEQIVLLNVHQGSGFVSVVQI